MTALWNKPKVRAIFYQAAILIALAAFALWLADNTAANLLRQGKAAGFGFLNDAAGFDINFHLIDYDESSPIVRVFAVGVLNTLLVSAMGIVLATMMGFAVGIARLSPNPLIGGFAAAYVEIFRNIPLLLQIFFWYFIVLQPLPSPKNSAVLGDAIFLNNRGLYFPKLIPNDEFSIVWIAFALGIILAIALAIWANRRQRISGKQFPIYTAAACAIFSPPIIAFIAAEFPLQWRLPELRGFNIGGGGVWLPPELLALTFALSIYTASFIAENVRAGLLSVGQGQSEAAGALGLRRGLALRLIVIPQAMRVIIPPLTNQYLNLAKNSSLAVAIAYPELVSVFTGTALNQSGHEVEIIFMTMLFYLSISLSIAMIMNWFNRRFALIEARRR